MRIKEQLYRIGGDRIYIALVFVVYIVLKLFRITAVELGDAANGRISFFDGTFTHMPMSHGPIPYLMHHIEYSLFGITDWSGRLYPFVLSLITFFLVYRFCKRFFSKKVALVAITLLTIIPWYLYSSTCANLPFEQLGFFIFLGMYTMISYFESGSKWHLAVSTVCYALATLSYESSFIFAAVVFFAQWIRKRKFFSAVKLAALYGFVLAVFLGLFLLWDYIFNNFANITGIITYTISPNLNRYATPVGFKMVFYFIYSSLTVLLWATPLLILPLLLYVFKHVKNFFKANVNTYLLVFVFFYYFFYMIVISPTSGYKEKYMSMMIPILIICAASYIVDFYKNFDFNKLVDYKKRAVIISTFALIVGLFILFECLNTTRNMISINRLDLILNNMLKFQANWDFPFAAADSSAGILINIKTIIIAYGLSVLSVVLAFVIKKHRKVFFGIALCVGIAFSMFITTEYLFHLSSPDYETVSEQTLNYALTADLNTPVFNVIGYSNYNYYLSKEYSDGPCRYNSFRFSNVDKESKFCPVISFDSLSKNDEYIDQMESVLTTEGGSIVFVDTKLIDKTGRLYKLMESCIVLREFSDKGVTLGKVYDCDNIRTESFK